jgi:CubicO group peptidase (beta-lactamase class C family)
MQHSYTSKAAAQRDGLAVGHRHWFSLPFPAADWPVPRGSLPSGQLISCAEDMAHYLIAHLNGGRYGDVQILSAAGIDELQRGAVDFTMFGIPVGRYGMGWFESNLGKTKIYSHGGNVPDFAAFAAIVPEQKKGIILLVNADPYGLPVVLEEVGMGVTALLAGQPPAPIKLDFIQWIMRLLPLIPLLQVVGAAATLRGWQREPASRPADRRLRGRQILLPLVPNLSLAAILVYLRSKGLLRYFDLFNPDLAWIARLSGGFGGIWGLLYTGLMLRKLSQAKREWHG